MKLLTKMPSHAALAKSSVVSEVSPMVWLARMMGVSVIDSVSVPMWPPTCPLL